jgi:hypothetical protein
MHSLHQHGTLREVLGLDHESSPAQEANGDAAGALNPHDTPPEVEVAAGIARTGQLLASDRVQNSPQDSAHLPHDVVPLHPLLSFICDLRAFSFSLSVTKVYM